MDASAAGLHRPWRCCSWTETASRQGRGWKGMQWKKKSKRRGEERGRRRWRLQLRAARSHGLWPMVETPTPLLSSWQSPSYELSEHPSHFTAGPNANQDHRNSRVEHGLSRPGKTHPFTSLSPNHELRSTSQSPTQLKRNPASAQWPHRRSTPSVIELHNYWTCVNATSGWPIDSRVKLQTVNASCGWKCCANTMPLEQRVV